MNLPRLHPVPSSTAIRSVGYVALAPELRGQIAPDADGFTFVRFRTGGTYAYLTPSWLYGLLRASRSTGRGYHALIRGRYPAIRVN